MDDHDRAYLERILEERDRQYAYRFKVAEDEYKELRHEVIGDRGRFVTVERYEAERANVELALDEAREFRGRVLGLIATAAILAGVVGAVVAAVVAHLLM